MPRTRRAAKMDIDREPIKPLIDEASPEYLENTPEEVAQAESDSDAAKVVIKSNSAPSSYDNRVKRYRYLLGQTELFGHFLKLKNQKDGALQTVLAEQKESKKTARRQRKTEKEEDEEILKGQAADDDALAIFTETPAYINGTMRDYQIQGLNWMISLFENGINGILADEMGLGKTLQTISFLGYLKHFQNTSGPHLVVVPKSTLRNWKNEFNQWIPDMDAFIFHGTKDTRAQLIKSRLQPLNFEVCITSYETCLSEKNQFKKIAWQYIIIDEAHRIKNENSLLSQIVRILNSRNRMLITGTPLQNNLHELWALLNFLLPDVFSSSDVFDEWFEEQNGDQKTVVEQLHKVLRPFLLRRIKSDVEKSLLPKKEINIYVRMSNMQKKWYQRILEKDLDAVNGAGVARREGKTRLLNIVMQLRKCCNHPYLFDGAEPGPPYTTDQHILDNAGKMAVLDKLLTRFKAQGSRVLIFSQMSRVLDILEDYCWWKDYECCRIDGKTSQEERVDAIDDYNRPDSDKFIFLLTTRAGGLGINLTSADIVIIYDSDWNPQVDLQAMDRAHRIGQTKQVYVFRFITENAIEEKVLERAAQKLRLDQLVIQQGRVTQSQKAASKDELMTMIQHGAEKIFKDIENNTEEDTITDDIDEILRLGEEKTAQLNKKYENVNIEDLKNFSSESAYKWDGKDWSNKRKASTGLPWLGPSKRERKVNYAVDDYYKDALRYNQRLSSRDVERMQQKVLTAKGPRGKKYIIEEYQFFPQRMMQLAQQEARYNKKKLGVRSLIIPDDLSPEQKASLENDHKHEQAEIMNAQPLTKEEEEEKKALYSEGFTHWGKKDFSAFVGACAKHGRTQINLIADEIEGKTVDEVEQYSKVFWQRYKELGDYEKHINRIERGESEREKRDEIQTQLTEKISQLRIPLQQLKINYSQPTKGKSYTEEEDRFLLVMLEHYGYGNENVYDNIRQDIRSSPLFRFDWFMKSRSSQEIARRCNTLVSLIQKENSEEDIKKKTVRVRRSFK